MRRFFVVVAVFLLMVFVFDSSWAGGVSKFAATSVAIGIVARFGSVYLSKMANESYDQYLHTAVQADMRSHLDKYRSRNRIARSLSASSLVFIAAGTLYSIYTGLSDEPEANGVSLRFDPGTGDFRLDLCFSGR